MIIQYFLTIAFFCMLVYGLSLWRRTPVVAAALCLAVAGGTYFVWLPGHATVVARWVGVGRGADLVLYCWVVASLALILLLHFRLRGHLQMITRIARYVALRDAGDNRERQEPPLEYPPVETHEK